VRSEDEIEIKWEVHNWMVEALYDLQPNQEWKLQYELGRRDALKWVLGK
jgi:hypothetical protein